MAKNNYIPKEIKEIIHEINSCDMFKNIDMKKLVDMNGFAYIVAEYAVEENIKTNQVRNFFGFIKKLERRNSWDKIAPDFYLLKPRMAIKVGRRDGITEGFFQVINVSMDKVDVGEEKDKKQSFKRFIEFFESIVAYHKYLEGEK